MLINLRNAMMSGKRLPYDAEVEYLESTGTQWIDTGVVPSVGCSMEIDAAFTNNPFESYLGGVHWDNNRGFAVGIVKNLNSSKFTALAGHSSVSAGSIDTQRHKFSLIINTSRSATFSVDDSSATNGSITFLASDLKIPLLARRRSSSTLDYYASAFLYACKIRVGDVLVRDFIPVRVGTVGYLYDRVSSKLFGNAGTGDFVLGPDVVPVEYIESHGTEWIDTGVSPVDGMEVSLRFSPTALVSGNKSFVFGSEIKWNDNAVGLILRNAGNHSIEYGSAKTLNAAPIVVDSDLDVRITKTGATYGSYSISYSGKIQGNDYPIYIFCANRAGTANQLGLKFKLYKFQIEKAGTLCRDLIPVRKGTTGYLYDRVSGKLFGNAGTGAFSYGNDLKYPIPAA